MSFIVNPFISFPEPYDSERSASIDGTDEYIDCGNDSSLNFDWESDWSVSIWMKPADTSIGEFLGRFAASRGLRLKSIPSSNQISVEFKASNSGVNGFVCRYSSISSGSWNHLVFSWSGGSVDSTGLTVYVDGSDQTGTKSTIINDGDFVSGDISTNTANFEIGRYSTSYFYGNIDEVSVWDKELSSGEVSDIYNSGVPDNLNNHSASGNLVSWWAIDADDDMTDTTGSVADKAGSNTGTPYNTESGDLDTDIPS